MTASRIMAWLFGAGALGSALNAGVFFAFSTFIMPALGRLPAGQAASAMQSINVVVLRSAFMPLFMGTALIAIAALIGAFFATTGTMRILTITGALLFLIGGFGVTIGGNVPLNDQLEAAGASGAALWPIYLARWTLWNTIRTAGCTLAAIALGIAARG